MAVKYMAQLQAKKRKHEKTDKNSKSHNDDTDNNVNCDVNDTSNLNVCPLLSTANDFVKVPNIHPKLKQVHCLVTPLCRLIFPIVLVHQN